VEGFALDAIDFSSSRIKLTTPYQHEQTMAAPPKEIIHAYRALYRAALHAVRYTTPSRHTVRDRLRRGFRASPASAYCPCRVANTLLFLRAAGTDAGAEHRLLRSLCHAWFLEDRHWRHRGARLRQLAVARGPGDGGVPLQAEMALHQAYDQFYFALRMLNETMGLCLR
jgi:hypothetical protein